MDFVIGLLCTAKKQDSFLWLSIFLSKMTHFIFYTKTIDASRVAELYFNEIVKLYDFPQTIILDKDVRFTNYF
jgi:hypothetical protein